MHKRLLPALVLAVASTLAFSACSLLPGGAGMVMRPEPWGEALDTVVTPESVIIFPSPAGERFTQATARELSLEQHLVFGCGRYEGIDQRVIDFAGSTARVREISLGDDEYSFHWPLR